jgi:hypothetical protein
MTYQAAGSGREGGFTVGMSLDNIRKSTVYRPGGMDHGPTVDTGKYTSGPKASIGASGRVTAESAAYVRGSRLQR